MNKKKWILALILVIIGLPLALYGWHLETTIGTEKNTILLLVIGGGMVLVAVAGVVQALFDDLVAWFHKK